MRRLGQRRPIRSTVAAVAAGLCTLALAANAQAQTEGGLYIAGAGFSFQVAAERAISQNSGGRRFFLLSLPPEAAALSAAATGRLASARDRVLAAGGVLLVCQRDIDNGRIAAAGLVPSVVAARGWPPQGNELPEGQRYFATENPAQLPAANEALRRLRSTCS